jgi:hypothetical protein
MQSTKRAAEMGDLVQIRDYQSKRNARAEKELERQAMEIMNVALMGVPDTDTSTWRFHTAGQGIDGMQFPYVAEDKDPA